MLRRTLLYLSEQGWLRRWVENSSVSRKLTSRFIAGQTLSDGIRVLGKSDSESSRNCLRRGSELTCIWLSRTHRLRRIIQQNFIVVLHRFPRSISLSRFFSFDRT